MSDYSIFVSLFIFFGLYGITTTANDTSYKDSPEGNINDTDISNVSVHCPSFECGYHLPQSLSTLSESLSLPVVDDCTGVKYINNDVMFYQSQQCVKIIDDNQLNIEAENELLKKLEQISQFIKTFNAAFSNCTQVFKEKSSAISGYYTMPARNGSLISVYCDDNAFDECSQISKENSSAISGYYTMRAPNGSLISVYCDDNAFDNCSQVFKENSSALSGYYTIQAPNGSLISVFCGFSFHNCSQILHLNSSAPSGYYIIQTPNGSLISVYCDMEGSNCDGKGGWMRVDYINMSEPNATCPFGLTLHQYNNIDHGLCSRPVSSSGSSALVFFSTSGVIYSKVCGQVIGYQYGSPDGFPPDLGGGVFVHNPNIDNIYVDGVSITYGSNPRKHIWTLGVGLYEYSTCVQCCPSNTGSTGTIVPSFVGNDYYCESGIASGGYNSVLYPNDPIWDGQQCGGLEGPCCTNPKMPWFIKTLNETTTEDIELRMMGSEGTNNEDTPIDILELYIL